MRTRTGEIVAVRPRTATPAIQLGVATAGFTLSFWAWALISPLGARYADRLDLTSFEQALLVATPVLVGSLGRIPVGALTDALGARRMLPAIAALTSCQFSSSDSSPTACRPCCWAASSSASAVRRSPSASRM